MDTRKLDEGSHLLGAISWGAIASGVFIALAVQTVLILLGLAFATSIGEGGPGGGYALWAILVELCSIALGAALTARLAHAERRATGAAAGVMVWAVALVLGGVLQGFTMVRTLDRTGIWAAFFGAAISLGAAIIGGSFGATVGSASPGPLTEHPAR